MLQCSSFPVYSHMSRERRCIHTCPGRGGVFTHVQGEEVYSHMSRERRDKPSFIYIRAFLHYIHQLHTIQNYRHYNTALQVVQHLTLTFNTCMTNKHTTTTHTLETKRIKNQTYVITSHTLHSLTRHRTLRYKKPNCIQQVQIHHTYQNTQKRQT